MTTLRLTLALGKIVAALTKPYRTAGSKTRKMLWLG